MKVIISKNNDKVKFIRSLNEKKNRQKNNCYYLEGIKVLNEVFKSDKAVNVMFIALSKEILENVNGGKELFKTLEKLDSDKRYEIFDIKKEIFETITDTKTPQGVLVVLNNDCISMEEAIKNSIEKKQNILLLDKVQDLGNLGTIIRSADAFNVNTILCTEKTADIYSPKVLRSTMGSILRQNIVYLKKEEISKLKNYGYRIVGTSLESSYYIDDFDFSKKCIFVVGNEANGISKDVINICDSLIKIKMSGNAESLNVAVATSILLYLQDK